MIDLDYIQQLFKSSRVLITCCCTVNKCGFSYRMQYLPPVINRLYSINAATLPLFSPSYQYVGIILFVSDVLDFSFNFSRKGTNLTTQQVRQYLTEYVKENQLQDLSKKG